MRGDDAADDCGCDQRGTDGRPQPAPLPASPSARSNQPGRIGISDREPVKSGADQPADPVIGWAGHRRSSTSWPHATVALDSVDLTVPTATPMTTAISARDRSP